MRSLFWISSSISKNSSAFCLLSAKMLLSNRTRRSSHKIRGKLPDCSPKTPQKRLQLHRHQDLEEADAHFRLSFLLSTIIYLDNRQISQNAICLGPFQGYNRSLRLPLLLLLSKDLSKAQMYVVLCLSPLKRLFLKLSNRHKSKTRSLRLSKTNFYEFCLPLCEDLLLSEALWLPWPKLLLLFCGGLSSPIFLLGSSLKRLRSSREFLLGVWTKSNH